MLNICRGAAFVFVALAAMSQPALAQDAAPTFQVDPAWPKPLPSNWIIGQVGGIFADSQNHIWIIHRPGTLTERESRAATDPRVQCCVAAPEVIEFDQDGNVIQAWSIRGEGHDAPQNEHGIYVDNGDYVWVGGNGENDGIVLKFTRNGDFVLQIGQQGPQTDSTDTARMGRPSGMVVDSGAAELFVSDGYYNHRVIVFDTNTGEFKRMWGAYGNPPEDQDMPEFDPSQAPPRQFSNPVHCITMSRDGEIFVCDRSNNRLQIFEKDGSFLREIFVNAQTRPGAVGSVAFWPDADQSLLFVSDDSNGNVHTIRREDGALLGSFGRVGTLPGEFDNLHLITMDRQGNIYTAEVQGKRVQKFVNMSGVN